MLMFSICIVLVASMFGWGWQSGKLVNSPSTAAAASAFKAGTYTGEAEGKDGVIKVQVTMEQADRIKDIKIVSQTETEGLGDSALNKIKEQILANQSLAVDAVSGASVSSDAMLKAVEDAVKKRAATSTP
ncbi:FMN-binding protein [Paenibacillus sp. HMSSN-139]|nr:FMN-binding protein [Paenibacillus sp. HMSSN-139]